MYKITYILFLLSAFLYGSLPIGPLTLRQIFAVIIIDNNTHSLNPADRLYMRHTPHGSRERSNQYSANAPIVIGENVWVGSNARIQKGVTIGDNSIIAANSVVTKDVPANSIAAGNPAKIVKTDIDKTTIPIFPLK